MTACGRRERKRGSPERQVFSDATATFDGEDFEGRFRSAEEIHAMSLANLQGQYATVLSTEEVLHRAD